jgi:hypothetical protein
MAPRPPLLVTITGADDGARIARMADLSARYPVEWGILFAPERQGAGRFPSLEFVAKLIERRGMRLSAHLCGGHACEVILRGACDELASFLAGNFERAQINTSERGVEADRVRSFADAMGMRGAILQCRGDFPADTQVDWLFDKSGGRGAAPPAWPKAREGAFCGYAGGLNPDTIEGALPAIEACVPEGQPYWIDMESGVRSRGGFDLDKCERVLMQVYEGV